jgi:hypothetical protein
MMHPEISVIVASERRRQMQKMADRRQRVRQIRAAVPAAMSADSTGHREPRVRARPVLARILSQGGWRWRRA